MTSTSNLVNRNMLREMCAWLSRYTHVLYMPCVDTMCRLARLVLVSLGVLFHMMFATCASATSVCYCITDLSLSLSLVSYTSISLSLSLSLSLYIYIYIYICIYIYCTRRRRAWSPPRVRSCRKSGCPAWRGYAFASASCVQPDRFYLEVCWLIIMISSSSSMSISSSSSSSSSSSVIILCPLLIDFVVLVVQPGTDTHLFLGWHYFQRNS